MYMCMLPTLHMYNTCDIFVGGKVAGLSHGRTDWLRLARHWVWSGGLWGNHRKETRWRQWTAKWWVGGPALCAHSKHCFSMVIINEFFFKSGIVYTDQHGPLCLAQPLELINTTQLPYSRLSVCLLLHGAIHLTRSNKIHQNVAVSYTHERSRGRGNRSDHRKL